MGVYRLRRKEKISDKMLHKFVWRWRWK